MLFFWKKWWPETDLVSDAHSFSNTNDRECIRPATQYCGLGCGGTRGDPFSPLRWTCKSTTHLAEELNQIGHPVSPCTIERMLNADGYSLQNNRKTKEGASHPDRNAQFELINATVKQFQERGQPVISVDTKKKELVCPFKNGGRE